MKRRTQLLEELYRCVLDDEKCLRAIADNLRQWRKRGVEGYQQTAAEIRKEARKNRRWRLRLLRELKEIP